MTQRTGEPEAQAVKENQIVDFSQVREKRLTEKRRKNERFFFKNLLGVYTVVSGTKKLQPIELVDVSEEGCSFQIAHHSKGAWTPKSAELSVRLYFNHESYIEILIKIQNSRPAIEKNQRYTRYGCMVDTSTKAYVAYQQFVKFLKLYSEHSYKDNGKVIAFY